MSYYRVSNENYAKVEKFFVEHALRTGSRDIEATVAQIAEGSNVALATAHKAIKLLEADKKLRVNRPSSRRFAITYTYLGDIEGFSEKQTLQEQVAYLQSVISTLQAELSALKTENGELKQQLRRQEIGYQSLQGKVNSFAGVNAK